MGQWRRLGSVRHGRNEEQIEAELWEAVQQNDIKIVQEFSRRSESLVRDLPFMQAIIGEAIGLGNPEMVTSVVDLFANRNQNAYQVGEFACVVATSCGETSLVLAILDLWLANNSYQIYSPLDLVAISVQASASPSRLAYKTVRNTAWLAETAIFVATVDKLSEVLRAILEWVEENKERVGEIKKNNADCILHAALEDDKEQVRILYSAGFRLIADTTRRVNKDYLKKIKLFQARASPVYCAVSFEQSQNVEMDDPMKKCLEYALQAKQYANKIQDFNREYNAVAAKSEDFAIKLLDKCTTKHEIQTLLQTKSYRGHHDANFNIAILDGHKEIVAHEKFQQLLHKKWGQRDRVHYGDDIRYNIFYSEMSKLQKLIHFFKQMVLFFILPITFFISTIIPTLEQVPLFHSLHIQTHIPVNRFIYYELSKFFFVFIIFLTLIDREEVAWYDSLAVLWIFSYILEDLRTIYRLYDQGGSENKSKTVRRWLTFKNIYILTNNLIFVVALILRYIAYSNNECRDGCPYEGNKTAFIGASLWAIGALLTFLRNVQTGLMWRQTGPIIISMTYMIIDVLVFLFIFVIVYISFSLCIVYIYDVYDDNRTQFFNTHKSAFKLFWWTLIRTGNPHFPNIREFNATLRQYNSSCIGQHLEGESEAVEAKVIGQCAIGRDGVVGEFDDDIEEGIPYVTGNILWAVYQFVVFIVLLSVLRARMVNTYHRIFRDADVQWKFFRASIWWKYLDHNSILPPPFTVIFLIYSASKKCWRKLDSAKAVLAEEDLFQDRKEFNKRYKRLLLTLVQSEENSWGFETKNFKSFKSIADCGGD